METLDILSIVWAGRDVLRHTLECLDVYPTGVRRRESGPIVVLMLETFQKLQRFTIPQTIVDAKLFFHQVPSPQSFDSHSQGHVEEGFVGSSVGGGSFVADTDDDDDDDNDSNVIGPHHSPKIRAWASNSLLHLELEIQGVGPFWCPPEVLNERIQQNSVTNVNGYPLFDPLKAYMDGFSQLDQSKIRYSARSPTTPSISPPTDSDTEY